MKSYRQFLKNNLLPLSTVIILMIAVFIVYTVFAIPDRYASTAVLKTTAHVSSVVKSAQSVALTRQVDDKFGFDDMTTKDATTVTSSGKTITISSLNEDAITSKKMTDGLVSVLSDAYPGQITVTTAAKVEDRPSSPSLLKNGAAGALCGLVIGYLGLTAYYFIKKRSL